jgi:hypothetical protein
MEIDYSSKRVTSQTVDFDGKTEDGKEFTITANWNDWDDWSVDEISWHDEEGTEEQEEEIRESFIAEMN